MYTKHSCPYLAKEAPSSQFFQSPEAETSKLSKSVATSKSSGPIHHLAPTGIPFRRSFFSNLVSVWDFGGVWGTGVGGEVLYAQRPQRPQIQLKTRGAGPLFV